MKKTNFLSTMSGWLRAFLLLALVFLAVGLGTLGSVSSTGDSYLLPVKKATDKKEIGIVLHVEKPDGVTRDLNVKEIYFNVGTVYNRAGETAVLRLGRGTSGGSTFYNNSDIAFESPFANEYGEEESTATYAANFQGALFNWVRFIVPAEGGWTLTSNSYYRLSAQTCDMLINEVVFVGNESDDSGEPVLMKASVYYDELGTGYSTLPYDASRGETLKTAVDKAAAVVDSQTIPSLAESSFFRFGRAEALTLMTVAELRQGENYSTTSYYHYHFTDAEDKAISPELYNGDVVFGALGTDLVALGAAIFGTSPFGMRVIPFLASFGILIFGALFVKRITHSEKAGFVFALLYALCGMSIGLGHIASPITVGVFFFVGALYFIYRFFEDGMKKKNFLSVVPVGLGGLFAAAAICVNGAFAIPAAGLVGLFAAGAVRQRKATGAMLEAAIDEVEADERNPKAVPPAEEGEERQISEPRKRLAAALEEHRAKTVYSVAVFAGTLLLGAFLISMIAVLPMYFTFVKLYDDPTAPTMNIFAFLWKSFAGGFAGNNLPLAGGQSEWSALYVLFRGTGEHAAVTATGSLVAIAAIAAGVAGAVLAFIRLAKRVNGENFGQEILPVLLLVVGTALSLATAAIGKAVFPFLLLAYLCLFGLGGLGASFEEEGKLGKAVKILDIVFLFALAVCFGLFAVFTFSIPSAGFLSGLIG